MPPIIDHSKAEQPCRPTQPPPQLTYPNPPKPFKFDFANSKVIKQTKRIQTFDAKFEELCANLEYGDSFDVSSHTLEYLSLVINLAERVLKTSSGEEKKRLVMNKVVSKLGISEPVISGLIDDLFTVWKRGIKLYKRPSALVRFFQKIFGCYK
jgi:hypothetical protein